MPRHQAHAIVRGLVRPHINHRRGHDLPHQGFARRTLHQDHFSGVVAFAEDALDLAVLHHQQRADAFLRHQLQRGVDRR
ncbi:hypothetical protein D3C81_1871720 [compost metagenome]